ncbi:unnamed protein product [Pedinophyceae sp. YPF-701]|nr:unnamed protein product [Pedinophyceae sp. YPF-701]
MSGTSDDAELTALVEGLGSHFREALGAPSGLPGFKVRSTAISLSRGGTQAYSEASARNSIQELSKQSPDPERLRAVHQRLAARSPRGLANFVCTLEQVARLDRTVLSTLSIASRARAARDALRAGAPSTPPASPPRPLPTDPPSHARPSPPPHPSLLDDSLRSIPSAAATPARAPPAPAPPPHRTTPDTSPSLEWIGGQRFAAVTNPVFGTAQPAPAAVLDPQFEAVGDLLDAQGAHKRSGIAAGRPYLTGDHLLAGLLGGDADGAGARQWGVRELDEAGLGAPEAQEAVLVDDVLSAMAGLEGRLVSLVAGDSGRGAAFQVAAGVERPLAELCGRILPACESALLVRRFCQTRRAWGSQHSQGLVSQALAAALEKVLAEWAALTSKMEHQQRLGRLSLQSALLFVQPAMHGLHVAASLAATAAEKSLRGGALLDLLGALRSANAGDASVHAVLHALWVAAARPYLMMLDRWLSEGVLEDPYEEFMVREDTHVQPRDMSSDPFADWWAGRFVLRGSNSVPKVLAGMADQILATGRTLAVARLDAESAGGAQAGPQGLARVGGGASASDWVGGAPDARSIRDAIDAAHGAACAKAMARLREGVDLEGRLRTMRAVFLMSAGDFITHLLDTCSEELWQPMHRVSLPRLQRLVEAAVRSTSIASDAYAEDVRVRLETDSLTRQLRRAFAEGRAAAPAPYVPSGQDGRRGLETFALDAQAPWPASLVLHRRALDKYKIIFRHFLFCKSLERRLCGAVARLRLLRGTGGPAYAGMSAAQRGLRSMAHVVREYLSFVTLEVVEPEWEKMVERVRAATSPDEAARHHESFLDTCLSLSLLHRPASGRRGQALVRLYDVLTVCDTALAPTESDIKEAEERAARADAGRHGAAEDGARAVTTRLAALVGSAAFAERWVASEEGLTRSMRALLEQLHKETMVSPVLSNLVSRLDWNQYFSTAGAGRGGAAGVRHAMPNGGPATAVAS